MQEWDSMKAAAPLVHHVVPMDHTARLLVCLLVSTHLYPLSHLPGVFQFFNYILCVYGPYSTHMDMREQL